MIVMLSLITGVIVGVLRAKSRKGNRLDMAQYGAVYGLIFAVTGLFLTVLLERML